MHIRTSTDGDVPALVALFSDSVHQLAARSYTPAQLEAWAPESPDLAQWQLRLAPLTTLVAEGKGGLAGFISYSDRGHIEFLFTSPLSARQGVASSLYEAAEQSLRSRNIESLSTEASIEARPFFESRGFSIIEEQVAERNGVLLTRFLMTRTGGEARA